MPSIDPPPVPAALQLRAQPTGSSGPGAALRLVALAVTLLVHWLVLGVLREPRVQRPPRDHGPAIEVVLITELARIAPPPPPPALQQPARPRAAAAQLPAPAPPRPPASMPASTPSLPAAAAPLFDDQARPRLPPRAEPGRGFVSPAQRLGDGRQLGRQRIALPGSDQPIVEIGRLPAAPTPEQIALGIAQFLFGRPQPDSCDRIELRLLNETHDLVRAIDLEKLQRLCRGGR